MVPGKVVLGKTLVLPAPRSARAGAGRLRFVPYSRLILRILLTLVALLPCSACAKSAHQTGRALLDRAVSSDEMKDVDQSVSFADLRADPARYVGKTVMFSGIVLSSRRTRDATEIELLQVPTEPGMAPSERKANSGGRFFAVQSEGFLDPAVMEKGSSLTVVGTVKGATTKRLDDGDYRYPVIDVRLLVDWNEVRSRNDDPYRDDYYGRYGGYYGPWSSWYYGFGSPFWGPYGFNPYSYYGPYYAFPFGYSVPAPAPPPPASVPPQFKK